MKVSRAGLAITPIPMPILTSSLCPAASPSCKGTQGSHRKGLRKVLGVLGMQLCAAHAK